MRRAAVPAAWIGALLFVASGPGFAVIEEPFTEMTVPAVVTRALFGRRGGAWSSPSWVLSTATGCDG
ncbi:hypothetical protein SFUMM280S_07402 [Streptomyces fumanus]